MMTMPRVGSWMLAILLGGALPGKLLSAQRPPQRKAAAAGTLAKVGKAPVRALPSAPGQPPNPTRPQLALQLGHSDQVTYVAFSADGQTLVTAGADKTARLWDVQQGELRAIIPLTQWNPLAAALSRDGRTFAVTGWNGVQLWDVKSGHLQATLAGMGSYGFLAISPDGKTLAGAGVGSRVEKGRSIPVGQAELWDVASGRRKALLKGLEGNFTAAAFSPDGQILATGGFAGRMKEVTTIADEREWKGEARLWDARTGQLKATLTGSQKAVWTLAFSPDGRTLATGSDDHTIAVWDVASRRLQRMLPGDGGGVRELAFSPDGQVLAAAGETVRLWDVKSGQLKGVLAQSKAPLAFSPDSRMVATGSQNQAARFCLWDARNGQLKTILPGTGAPASGVAGTGTKAEPLDDSDRWREGVRALAFSPDGKMLATGSNDKAARLWDVASGQMVRALHGHSGELWSHVFSSDGKLLATSSRDRALRLWDTRSGQLTGTFFGPADWVPWPPVLAFSPDGKLLAAGGGIGRRDANGSVQSIGGATWLWNIQTGQLEATLRGQHDAIHSLAFSPDGSLLATGGWDKSTDLWDLRSRRLKAILRGHPAEVLQIAFSRDGKIVATGSGLGGYRSREEYVASGEIRVWDAQTGQLKAAFSPHAGPIDALAFSPDGRKLGARFRLDGPNPKLPYRLWDLASGKSIPVTPPMKWSDFARGETWWIETEGAALTLRDLKEGRERATLLPVPDVADEVARNAPPVTGAHAAAAGTGEWFVTTPEGYFDCSANAARFIKWNVNGTLYPAERYLRRFRRPDLVRKALRGERITAAAMTAADIPPTAQFVGLTNGTPAPGNPMTITVEARSRREVREVEFLVNGRPLPPEEARPIDVGSRPIDVGARPIDVGARPIEVGARESGAAARVVQRFTYRISLPQGSPEVHLRAVAYDAADLGSDPAEVVLRRTGVQPVTGNLYVLCVGVSHYQHAREGTIQNLRFPAADARAVAARFQREGQPLYQQVQVRTLTDEQATAANVRAELKRLQREVRPGQIDTVVLFLSGHGASVNGHYYYGTYETDPKHLAGTTLSGEELKEALGGALRAKAVFLFVDTCHAGGLGGRSDDLALEVGDGVFLLASSGAKESAYESEQWGHGAFTLALLRALDERQLAREGVLYFNALAYAVPDQVADLMKAAGRNEAEQEPCIPLAARRLRVPICQVAQ
jgi:WD40 repeat protein